MPISPNAFGEMRDALIKVSPPTTPTMACIAVAPGCIAGKLIDEYTVNANNPKNMRFIKLGPASITRDIFGKDVPHDLEFHRVTGTPGNLHMFVISHTASLAAIAGDGATVHLSGEGKPAANIIKNGMRPSMQCWQKLFGNAFGSVAPPGKRGRLRHLKRVRQDSDSDDGMAAEPEYDSRRRRPPMMELQRLMAEAEGPTRETLQALERRAAEYLRHGMVHCPQLDGAFISSLDAGIF